MIAYITGTIAEKNPAGVILDKGGFGIDISLSLTSSEQLGSVGETATLFTHLHVREDVLRLYGFATVEERLLFRLLISVSGIGPKVALGILSGISVAEFKQAVMAHDVNTLKSAPGVGKKTAERLALELKDKIQAIATVPSDGIPVVIGSAQDEAILALTSLGYRQIQAEESVRKAVQLYPDLSVEELIRVALRGM